MIYKNMYLILFYMNITHRLVISSSHRPFIVCLAVFHWFIAHFGWAIFYPSTRTQSNRCIAVYRLRWSIFYPHLYDDIIMIIYHCMECACAEGDNQMKKFRKYTKKNVLYTYEAPCLYKNIYYVGVVAHCVCAHPIIIIIMYSCICNWWGHRYPQYRDRATQMNDKQK